MELRLLRLTVHFFSATVERNRYSQLQLTEILRINFNHFEKLIINFHRSKTSLLARFYLSSQATE